LSGGAGRARRTLAVCCVFVAGVARAQFAAQVGVASDYIYRGVSLNDGRPTPTASASYDAPAGWFVGGQVAETRFYGGHGSEPLWVADAGYAHALTSRLSWEVGATYSIFTHFAYWNYAETFAGISAQNWNLRLYYAPNYFGRQRRSTYLEFNLTHPLGEHLRLIGHLGAQHSEPARGGSDDLVFDASLGAGAKFERFDLQLLWIAASHANSVYPVPSSDGRRHWLLSAACAF